MHNNWFFLINLYRYLKLLNSERCTYVFYYVRKSICYKFLGSHIWIQHKNEFYFLLVYIYVQSVSALKCSRNFYLIMLKICRYNYFYWGGIFLKSFFLLKFLCQLPIGEKLAETYIKNVGEFRYTLLVL